MVTWNDEGEALRLERRHDGQLWASRGDEERPVQVRRLFPWSDEDRHVSLRDADGDEFALVGPGAPLDPASRRVLDDAIAAAGFVLEVERVVALDEEVEIRVWTVDTAQGRRTFQTALDDWPREMPGGGLLIRDVAGDLYLIDDPSAVDPKSRELLWAFVG